MNNSTILLRCCMIFFHFHIARSSFLPAPSLPPPSPCIPPPLFFPSLPPFLSVNSGSNETSI